VRRFAEPPAVPGGPLLITAIVGLLINLVSFRLLSAGAKESITLRGASLEVLGDALGSVGVIVAAILLLTTGWAWADPIVGVLIGLLILRELVGGARRYGDLKSELPGIATNLLADRLRDLEDAGLVDRTDLPAPIARTTPCSRSSMSAGNASRVACSSWSSGSCRSTMSIRSVPRRARLASIDRFTPSAEKSHSRRTDAGTTKP
jgi:uncharacterized membrane-anchored protein YhcB (DUF1043 family)